MQISQFVPPLLKGAEITVELTLMGAFLALILSFLGGLGKTQPYAILRWVINLYIEVFRGTSLLVQMFWMYFVFPFFGIKLPAMLVGILALGLNYGAYGSEVVYSAIRAVPKGQWEAAIALNFTKRQQMWLIIMPQAIRMMIPTLGNMLIDLLKNTSIVSLITVSDLTFQGLLLQQDGARTSTIFTLLLILYFAMAYPLRLGVSWIEKRFDVGRG